MWSAEGEQVGTDAHQSDCYSLIYLAVSLDYVMYVMQEYPVPIVVVKDYDWDQA